MMFFKKRAEQRKNERKASTQLIKNELEEFKKLGYENLKKRIDTVEVKEINSGDNTYQVEISFMYDDPSGKETIRVMGIISDKKKLITSISPVTECFLINPDGSID